MFIATLRHTAPSKNVSGVVKIGYCGVVARHYLYAFKSLRSLQTQSSPVETVPFRKQVKDEFKRRKSNETAINGSNAKKLVDETTLDRWELTVGLEIHAQLNTKHKLFSGKSCKAPIYTRAFQKATLLPAIRAALALGCQIQQRSQFDRKHYFYADQPAGYQITQYYEPLAKNGAVVLHDHDGIAPEDGHSVQLGIKQVQLEQDTAKTVLQPPSEAMLDFNRVSHPLIEVIMLPQIHQPKTASACVRKIQALLQTVSAVTTGMELGGLRVDVNVSVRRKGSESFLSAEDQSHGLPLGQRTEIKNLSSIKAVEDAILAERDRQISVLESGGTIQGETRGWTLGASDTVKLRGKEGEVDYRYMPDPDLRPLFISDDLIATVSKQLPQSPDQMVQELIQSHGLTIKDARTLVELDDGERLDYFDQVCEKLAELPFAPETPMGVDGKKRRNSGVVVANWVLHEMGGLLSTSRKPFSPTMVPTQDLAYIVKMLEVDKITGRTAKQLFARKFDGDERNVESMIEQENLLLVQLSEEQYEVMARELLDSNPVIVAQIKKGHTGKLGFFVGQMMRKGEGKVVAQKAEATLRRLLGIPVH